MLNLHRGDCEPCKSFQKHFKEAHKKRRGLSHKLKDRKENDDGALCKSPNRTS